MLTILLEAAIRPEFFPAIRTKTTARRPSAVRRTAYDGRQPTFWGCASGGIKEKCWLTRYGGRVGLRASFLLHSCCWRAGRMRKRPGNLPETLQALVPDYLPAVPRDPFDGQPFRYSTERRIIYSVGEDLTDDGGTRGYEQGRRQRQKDLVFDLFTHEPEPQS